MDDFMDTFKKIVTTGANVGHTVLSIGSPFLGPVGGPIGAVAGAALSYAGGFTESSLVENHSYEQYASRAILGEAALQSVLKMDYETRQKYGVLESMADSYSKTKSNVPEIAQMIGPVLMEPALRIAVATSGGSSSDSSQYPKIAAPLGVEAAMDKENEAFVEGLVSPSKDGGDGSLDFINTTAKLAVNVAPPLSTAIGPIVASLGDQTSTASVHGDLQPHFETVCQRALIGDAALQAICRIPPNELTSTSYGGSVFENMTATIKSIGPDVIRTMPGVIKNVELIVQESGQKK